MASKPVYALRPGEVFDYLQTRQSGLSSVEVSERQALYGRNILQPPASINYWRVGFHHLLHPMAAMLWICSIVALIAHQPLLSLIICG
ncbi:MAG TPA: cation-transporting P-type ATPase, partial [Leptolinea sp.]